MAAGDTLGPEQEPTPTAPSDCPKQRTSYACDVCRRRKGRCQYATPRSPKCVHCDSFDLQCTFLHPGLGKGIRRKRKRLGPLGAPAIGHHERVVSDDTSLPGIASREQCASGLNDQLFQHPSPPLRVTSRSTAELPTVNALPTPFATHQLGPFEHGPDFPLPRSDSGNTQGRSDFQATRQTNAPANLRGTQAHDVIDVYRTQIEPYMPFLDSRALLLKGCAVSDLVLCCIMITAHAFESQRRDLSDEITKRMAMRYLEETSVSALTDDELRAVLLLSLRTSFVDCGTHAEATLDKVIQYVFDRYAPHSPSSPIPTEHHDTGAFSLYSCAIITSAWKRLEDDVRMSTSPRLLPPITLAPFPCAFFDLCQIFHQSQSARREDLPEIESGLLLWPATLPTSLAYIDRALSSIESSFLHVLHNAVCLRYYIARLQRCEMWLEPNQGMLSFLTTLGYSSVKVWERNRKNLIQSWGNLFIKSISSTLRDLKSAMQLYNCDLARGVLLSFLQSLEAVDLQLFGDTLLMELSEVLGLQPSQNLAEKQHLIRSGVYGTPFAQLDSEGTIIYWMFRDVRSMMLSGFISRRRHSNLSSGSEHQSSTGPSPEQSY